MGPKRDHKRRREDEEAGPSHPTERSAHQEQQPTDDASASKTERDFQAAQRAFDISLTRELILRHKVALEKEIRTDEDIRKAVKEWHKDRVAAERRYGHISDWDVSRVTNMSGLFWMDIADCKETGMESFRRGIYFNDDLSRWETGNVTDMQRMFQGARRFCGDLSQWQTGKVTNMSEMFRGAENFKCDLSQWQTGNVTDMNYMFNDAVSFTSDLSQWQTGNVTNMSGMFRGSLLLSSKLPHWYGTLK